MVTTVTGMEVVAWNAGAEVRREVEVEVKRPMRSLLVVREDVVTVTKVTATEDEVISALVVREGAVLVPFTLTTGAEEESWTTDDEDRTSVVVRTSLMSLVDSEGVSVAVVTTTGTEDGDAVRSEEDVTTTTLVETGVSVNIDDEDTMSVEVRTSVTTLVDSGGGPVAVTTTTGTKDGDAVTKEEDVTTTVLVVVGMTLVTTTPAAEGLWNDGDVVSDR